MKSPPFSRLLVCTFFLSPFAPAQIEDLDALSDQLDLSILETGPSIPEEQEEIPANHLFGNFDLLPLPETEKGIIQQDEVNRGLYLIQLPDGSYLVAPNPARIDSAYETIANAVQSENLKLNSPLKVVLHADGNFSIAVGLREEPAKQLPAGLDLSPLPPMVFAAVIADIHLLKKEHPPVLEAFLQLRELAARSEIDLDTREFYFFPVSPGKVYFALRVKQQSLTGKPQDQE